MPLSMTEREIERLAFSDRYRHRHQLRTKRISVAWCVRIGVGFSVDCAGDYNNDFYPDLIVGAPAGADLSSLGGIFTGQFLGGSAYVYYGTGSAVTSSIGARLQANPSGLLSNTANLFGYDVKAQGMPMISIMVVSLSAHPWVV